METIANVGALAVGVVVGYVGMDLAIYCWRRATGKIDRKGDRL